MKDPEIVEMEAKKLMGISLHTSLTDDKTALLWKRFMKQKKEISNTKSDDLFSVQVYDEGFMKGQFNSQSIYEKWAALEVEDYSELKEGLKGLKLPGGLYAVFTHEGTSKEFAETAKFIFDEWIPASQYSLDNRPHFEVLGEEYKGPENPDSKEKIWIPIKKD
ncbi:AraC family transcriptional regulator [Christiangramia gaetbulicola]|uniref:AraC family transcriptional regulator n=1 Tax=Christiangramia gaetbulicola TaxID=703340 RepID=A0A2T6AGN7_9FLAO|nr:GyrI-like domain-containing protein [Christiangramia gaetbulicola]PTX42971.1 AraC family transcriptional regulator [Christiangramia gaetbulicola]